MTMNCLSLCDGISTGMYCLQQAGIKVGKYYASEIDKYPMQVSKKNYPEIIQIGDIKNVRVRDIPHRIDLILAGTPCFKAGSLVMTPMGYKPIESIEVGDLVLTHTGSFKHVLNTGVAMKEVWKLSGMGNLGIYTTAEHPFFVRKKYRDHNGERKFTTADWVKVQDVDISTDYAGITHTNPSIESDGRQPYQQNQVYDVDGKSPSLSTGNGHNSGVPAIAIGIVNDRGTLREVPRSLNLDANYHKGMDTHAARTMVFTEDLVIRRLSPIECEFLQGLPRNYTYGIASCNRYKSLGNGWQADTIIHLLSFMRP